MRRTPPRLRAFAVVALMAATRMGLATPPSVRPGDAPPPAAAKTVDWEDLVPEDARSEYMPGPPPPMHDYLGAGTGVPASQEPDFRVNKALDGQRVRLPGFVVPLERDSAGKVTEFLLVPYFGACIHVPPPPPNQLVFVRARSPLTLDSVDSAVWVTGQLSISVKASRLGAAAYTLIATELEAYKY